MPTATQNEIRGTVSARQPEEKSRFAVAGSAAQPLAASVPGCAGRLVQLLAEDPVDLARVSDEIRAQPALADVVQRVAASLQLVPEDSASSVEEAAIVLGTDRLRVLLSALPQFDRIARGTATTAAGKSRSEESGKSAHCPAAPEAVASEVAWTPESFYLASFVRFLGLADLDTGLSGEGVVSPLPDGARSEAAAMTEILIRDFLALVPRMRRASGSI